jgi:hypothetical protein
MQASGKVSKVFWGVVGASFLIAGLVEVALMAWLISLYDSCASTANCSTAGVDVGDFVGILTVGIVMAVGGLVALLYAFRSGSPSAGPSHRSHSEGPNASYRAPSIPISPLAQTRWNCPQCSFQNVAHGYLSPGTAAHCSACGNRCIITRSPGHV